MNMRNFVFCLCLLAVVMAAPVAITTYKMELWPKTTVQESQVSLPRGECIFGFVSPSGKYWGAYQTSHCVPYEFLWWTDEEIILQIKTLGIQGGYKLLSVTIDGKDQNLSKFMAGWSKDY